MPDRIMAIKFLPKNLNEIQEILGVKNLNSGLRGYVFNLNPGCLHEGEWLVEADGKFFACNPKYFERIFG